MRKHLLLFLILFIFAGGSYGQVVFGPKLGYTGSKFLKEYDDFTQSCIPGYHIGMGFGIELTENLIHSYPNRNPISLRVELLFERRGAEYSYKTADYKFSLESNYITVPIIVQYSLEAFSNFFINIEVGCYTSYWASGEWNFGDSVNVYSPLPFHWTVETDIEFDQRFQQQMEWGLLAGLGLEYRFDKFSVVLSGRRNWGQTSAFVEDPDFKYRINQFSAGMLWYF